MSDPRTVSARDKLLDAALAVIRTKGYTATTVDDICHVAGVSKGSFFHHFTTKEQLAVQAAAYFGKRAQALFGLPFRSHRDPLERVLGYIDVRIALVKGEIFEYTCLLGTMVQEIHDTSPDIRASCEAQISLHTAEVAKDLEAAKKLYLPEVSWTSESLALYTQAVIQGALVLAKAKQGPEVAIDCLKHLRRYIELLFKQDITHPDERAPLADQ